MNVNLEAVITLPVEGPAGQTQEVEAVVDTGFNRYLTLPPALVAELGLPLQDRGLVTLADGSEEVLDICGATVDWDGQPRYVDTYVADATPLVGMSLLHRHDLSIQVRAGGRVVIQPME